MGHRFSKPQRQLTTDSQTVATAPHSCSDQPADATVAETTATPRVSLQQVSAIVITICMLKVDGEPPVIDAPPSTVMSSPTGSCARHASDVVHSINGNASSSSSCDACAQLQLLSLDNCSDRLLADQSTASASASSSKSAAATTTTAPTRAAVAVQQPPLISMRDIAGDSADDDDDDNNDCDDNETLRLRITPVVAAAVTSLPSDKHNNNRLAGTTTSPTAVSIDNNNAITIANYKKTVLLAAQLATSNNCGESARQQQQPQQQQHSESVGASLIAATTDQQDGGGISDGSSANLYASLLSGSSGSSSIATAGCVDCKRPPAPQQHRKKSLPTTATPCTSCGRPTPAVAVSIVGKPKTKSSWKLNCAKLITGKASASGSCSSSSNNSSPHSTASVFNVSAASCAAIVGASVVVSSSSSSSGALHASSTVALDKSTACVGTSYRRMDDRELIAAAVPAATARGSADIYLLPSLQQQQRSSAAHSGNRQRIANDPTDDADDDDDDYNHEHQHHQQQAAGAANRTHHSVATTATACATAAVQQMLLQSLHSGAGPPPSLCAQSPSSSSGGHPQLGNSAMGSIVIHSQVEYVHCLVPDLQRITASAFYWGKMDRYEAERLLDGKPEGTFLLRDSAQEEFLFSVSFRKYARSLHARIEQFNHKFSFDCHDPGVYTSDSVTGLLEHYKDPACVMFFEPALTLPLTRNYCFTLQELCRAAIVSRTSYDGVAELQLPVTLRAYLREYHYRKRVRVQRFDEPSLTVSAAYEPTTTTIGGRVDSATVRQPQTFAEPLDDGSASSSFTSITK